MPNTLLGLPYPAATDAVTGGAAAIQALAEAIDAKTRGLGIGTTFPPAPTDGQEFTLVDSLTLPTYAWRFRYVASITDANKWLFIGGGPAMVEVAAQESIASSAFTNLATVGPVITVSRAGLYLITFGVTGTTNAAQTIAAPKYSAAEAVDADAIHLPAVGMTSARAHSVGPKTVPAGQAITLRYRTSDGSSAAFFRRWMQVLPVRVA